MKCICFEVNEVEVDYPSIQSAKNCINFLNRYYTAFQFLMILYPLPTQLHRSDLIHLPAFLSFLRSSFSFTYSLSYKRKTNLLPNYLNTSNNYIRQIKEIPFQSYSTFGTHANIFKCDFLKIKDFKIRPKIGF